MIQKAHYQHKSQFPYCARRVGRVLFRPAEPERQSGFLLPPWIISRPDFHQGSRRNHFLADTAKQRLLPDRKSRLPTFPDIKNQAVSEDLPPPVILSSNPDLRTPWATALLAREVPLEPMKEMSGLASQRSCMTGLSSKPRTHRMYNRCRRCENLTVVVVVVVVVTLSVLGSTRPANK